MFKIKGKYLLCLCSEPDNVRLVQEDSHCAGILEMKLQGEWTPVDSSKEDLQLATLVCRRLKCGSAVSTKKKASADKTVLGIPSQIQPGSSLREHISLRPWKSHSRLEIVCSGNNFSDSVVMVHFCNFFIILTANQENVIKTSD